MKRSTSNRLKRKERVYHEIIAKHIFADYFYLRTLEETCARITQYSGVIKKLILLLDQYDNIHYRWLKKSNRKLGIKPRSKVTDVDGYESIAEIESTLNYISDRFKCDLRLRWMLNVPDKVKELL